MGNIEVSIEPHYFSNLIGSLFVSVNIIKGQELNDKDIFGSSKFFHKLSEMYLNWTVYTNYTIPPEYCHTIEKTMSLLTPIINLVAGLISSSDSNVDQFKDLIDKFSMEIDHFTKEKKYLDTIWSFYIQQFYLRKGTTDWNYVKKLLYEIIPVVEWYHLSFYHQFWIEKELSYYEPYIKQFSKNENLEKTKKSIILLQKWLANNKASLKFHIILNRFLSSYNKKVHYESGFGLTPNNKIIVSPKFDLEGNIHEIGHVIQGYPNKYIQTSTMKRIASQIVPYCGFTESPIAIWSLSELIQMEIQEILTDYLTGQVLFRLDPLLSFKCCYCKEDPFLMPLFNRLQNFNNLLGEEPFDKILKRAFTEWTYRPI